MNLEAILINQENIDLGSFILSIALSIIFAIILNLLIFNILKRSSSNFYSPILFMTLIPSMVIIITIIKSSIALSLGLVGALSIVRFRTPIKDPEELVLIFIAIAVGIGLGANKFIITSIFFVVVISVIFFVNLKNSKPQSFNLNVSLSKKQINMVDIIYEYLDKSNIYYEIKSINYNDDTYQFSININLSNKLKLEKFLIENKVKFELSSTPIVFD
tara:strand:- start:1201 stop:1851 length:651 start_codon:yes stop_codon:yes gene_type:complete